MTPLHPHLIMGHIVIVIVVVIVVPGVMLAVASAGAAYLFDTRQVDDSTTIEAPSNPQVRCQWGERIAEDVLRLASSQEKVNYQKQMQIEGGTIRAVGA